MRVALATGETTCHRGQRCRPRLGGAQVEHPWLVAALPTGEQTVPVERPEERPDGDRADVDRLSPQLNRGLPDLVKPTKLLLARAAVVSLGNGERQAVTVPGFREQRAGSGRSLLTDARCQYVGIGVTPVSAVRVGRIAVEALVEKPLTAQVMVDAHDVRRAGVLLEPVQVLLGRSPQVLQPAPQRMVGVD